MHHVTPFPDFDDEEQVQRYIQDRRVIGVCFYRSYPAQSAYLRCIQYDPLVQPAYLRHEIVSSFNSKRTIASARYSAARIVAGQDDRVIVVVGPCSIHSTAQAVEYANLLKSKIPSWSNLLIIMRAYLFVHLFSLVTIR